MQQRDQGLDALRGLAILGMVLSSSIAFGILPAWMYHAQEPPPSHQFIPTLPGISWVDLVFPFFLFSMGAAIPLALDKKRKEGAGFTLILWIAILRLSLLVFFALFTLHMRPGSLSEKPEGIDYGLSMAAFMLLFFQFYQPAGTRFKKTFLVIRLLAFGAAGILLYLLPFGRHQGFSLYNSDIIILLLGNMAFFGTLTWWATKDHPFIRIALLPFLMAVFLGSWEAGSFNELLFNATPFSWLYKFQYLKYLFIILPGTLAGEWLLEKVGVTAAEGLCPVGWHSPGRIGTARTAGLLSFVLVISNIVLLFSRHTMANLLLTVLLCGAIAWLMKRQDPMAGRRARRFFAAGAYLLLLGLFFEAYEGGIKKDPSTFSYYLVSAGLAFFMLIGFSGAQSTKSGRSVISYLSLNGRNPMVAYVAGNLLIVPLLNFTGAITLFQSMENGTWTGILRGVLFTGLVSVITVFFTRRGWYWKT